MQLEHVFFHLMFGAGESSSSDSVNSFERQATTYMYFNVHNRMIIQKYLYTKNSKVVAQGVLSVHR